MTPGRSTLVTALAFALVATGCGSRTEVSGGSPPATTGATRPEPTVPTAGTATPTDPPEALPSPTSVTHGGRAFGVYVAAAPFGSPELDAAVERLAELGVEAFPSDIACDEGAAEQLGVPGDLAVVAVYLETQADAEAWSAALDPPPLGIASVRTFCLD